MESLGYNVGFSNKYKNRQRNNRLVDSRTEITKEERIGRTKQFSCEPLFRTDRR